MANQEHLDLLKQGVEVWNQGRKEPWEFQSDLSGANLSYATLNRAILSDANLSRTDLSDANINLATLRGTPSRIVCTRAEQKHLEA